MDATVRFGDSLYGDFSAHTNIFDRDEYRILTNNTENRVKSCGNKFMINGKKYYEISRQQYTSIYGDNEIIKKSFFGDFEPSGYKATSIYEESAIDINMEIINHILVKTFGIKYRSLTIKDIEKRQNSSGETTFEVKGNFEKLMYRSKFYNCNLVFYPGGWHPYKFEGEWVDGGDRWIAYNGSRIRKSDNTIIEK